MNERTPSRESSAVDWISCAIASARKDAARSPSGEALSSRLVRLMAVVGPAARRRGDSARAASCSPAGTTPVARPRGGGRGGGGGPAAGAAGDPPPPPVRPRRGPPRVAQPERERLGGRQLVA